MQTSSVGAFIPQAWCHNTESPKRTQSLPALTPSLQYLINLNQWHWKWLEMFNRLLQKRDIQKLECLSNQTANRENNFFRLLTGTMFNPSVKIFGLHCWDLIDFSANTKILISYEGTNYSNHRIYVLWPGSGRRVKRLHLIAGATVSLRRYVGCRQTSSRVKQCMLLPRVRAAAPPPPLPPCRERSSPNPPPSSDGAEPLHFPFGLAELQRCCLAKGFWVCI